MAIGEAEFETLEIFESESEAAERGPRRPSSQPSFRPRPAPGTPNAVTQGQLEAALARVDGKIKTVGDGVTTINSRAAAAAAMTKKEAIDRKKAEDGLNKDLNQKLQLLALLPLLISTPSVKLASPSPLQDANGNDIPALSVPDTNQLDSLLPLLLVSGMGGTGGLNLGGDGSSGGSDGSLMLLALVLAFANKKTS